MNEQHRKQVLEYINKEDCSPLRFRNSIGDPVAPRVSSATDLEDLITKVLSYMYNHFSVNDETGDTETGPLRWRSVLDIWRHIKYIRPEITIFDVMDTAYSMGEDLLKGQYCFSVCRRTFLPESIVPGAELLDLSRRDEFGLTFYEWDNI